MENLMKEMEDRFGQIIALIWVLLHKLLPLQLTVSEVQDLIKNKDHPFWVAFDRCVDTLRVPPISVTADGETPVDKNTKRQIRRWKHFYKKYFHLDLDMTGVKIPAHVPGFDRLIIVAKGLSINHIYEVGKKNFSWWKWCDEDIESQMRESERGKTTSTYAIWVRDDREADEGTRNLSAEDISSQKIDTENLLERLIHGFEYWSEKGEHLDVDSVTLCAASRYAGGDVPDVGRSGDGSVYVDWFDPQDRGLGLGARRAVR